MNKGTSRPTSSLLTVSLTIMVKVSNKDDDEEGGVPFDLIIDMKDGEDEDINNSDEAFGDGEEEAKWKGRQLGAVRKGAR